MCIPNAEYQLINPTTQIALFSHCLLKNCSSIENIKWNVYSGEMNSTLNITIWTLFNSTDWFYGQL
jgi:hypothetical protein